MQSEFPLSLREVVERLTIRMDSSFGSTIQWSPCLP
jgi:hypothetical protein